MHSSLAKTVVTICDSQKKTFREHFLSSDGYDKKTEVVLPFGTEYQFHIKNMNFSRIKVTIKIDGISIGDDLIVRGNSSVYLDRFIEKPKKFKFVELTNDAIQDPTNSENGIVEVVIVTEKANITFRDEYCGLIGKRNKDNSGGEFKYGGYVDNNVLNNALRGSTAISDNAKSVNGEFYSCYIPRTTTLLANDQFTSNGATIDGEKSNQTFNVTTWLGDDYSTHSKFTFHLKGATPVKNNNIPNEDLEILFTLYRKYGSDKMEELIESFKNHDAKSLLNFIESICDCD